MEKLVFDKNSTYSVIDITNALVAATDRFKDFDSARGVVNQTIVKLGVQSVNGQKRNRYFTGLDSQRVYDAIPLGSQSKQIPLISANDKTQKVKLLSLDTTGGLVYINPDDIGMISLPPLRYYLTFRGWGSVVRLKTGKSIHVKQELHEVKQMIRDAWEN